MRAAVTKGLGAFAAAAFAIACGGSEQPWTRSPGMTTVFVHRRGADGPVPVLVVVRVDGVSTFKAASLDPGSESVIQLWIGPHTLSVSIVTQVPDNRGGVKTPRVFRATQDFDLTNTSALVRVELVANGSPSGYELRYGAEQARLGRSTTPVEVAWVDASIQVLDELLATATGRGEPERARCIVGHRSIGLDAKLSSDETPAGITRGAEAIAKAIEDARACATPLPPTDALGVDPCAVQPSPCAPVIQRQAE